MSWGEAVELAKVLVSDPSSRLGAEVGEYDHPWTREWAATVDLFDRITQLHGAKANPYPRPWPDPNTKRRGRTNKSRAEVISILNAHGHKIAG